MAAADAKHAHGQPSDQPTLERLLTSVVGVLPDWAKVLIAGLASLALLFGALWLIMHIRARRLRREGRELTQDADLLEGMLLPRTPERLGPLRFSVAVEPGERLPVGRGFHDVFALGRNRAGIVIGQVSPHGEAPLAEAALLRHRLRAHLQLGLAPRSALRRAGELRDGDGAGGFAAATVAVYDGARGTITYACAGHPTPLLVGPAADALTPLPQLCAPLGTASRSGQRQTVISLRPGSMVCIYSDGVQPSPGGPGRIDRDALSLLTEEVGPEPAALLGRFGAGLTLPDDFIVCFLRAAVGACGPLRHVEELVVTGEDSSTSHRFLLGCRLAPGEAAELAAAAVDRAGPRGESVLRVSWGPDGPEPEVLAYRGDSEWPVQASAALAATL